MPINQLSDITNMGRFLPQVFEDAYDKLTILIQQLKEVTDRTLQAAVGTTVKLIFPAPSSGKFLRWRSDLTGLENVDAGTDSMALQGLLADAGDVTHGTALIGWKANAAGSTGRTLSVKLGERLSVKDFGAVGDGVTDDTLAIQAAINWAGPRAREIFFPRGDYLYGGVTVSDGWSVHFIGENTAATSLSLNNGAATGFNCATSMPVTFEKLTFQYKTGVIGTAGAFIALPGGATMNANSRFRSLQMNGPWIGINATGAYAWLADTVFMGNFVSVALVVGNSFVGDAGDSTISNCVLTTNVVTAIGISHVSSGGLRIISNKHIGGFCFYSLGLASGVNTSDLLITGNSIEGTSSSGLLASRQSTTGTFSNVVITGNQFAGIQFPINFNNGVTGWFSKLSITGNVFLVSANGVGVNISTASGFQISGNQFTATDATSKAISIALTASDGQIGSNEYSGFTIALTNLSPSTAVTPRIYRGTINVNATGTAGALFAGAATFSIPPGTFRQTPTFFCTIAAGNNGVAANVSSQSVGGCTVTGFAVAAQTLTVNVVAMADY